MTSFQFSLNSYEYFGFYISQLTRFSFVIALLELHIQVPKKSIFFSFFLWYLLDFEFLINSIGPILVIRVNHVWQKRTLIDFRFCLTQVDPSYWFSPPINSVIGRHSLRLTCVSFRLFRAGELWISSLRPFKRFFIESNAFCNSWGFFCVVAWANSRTLILLFHSTPVHTLKTHV